MRMIGLLAPATVIAATFAAAPALADVKAGVEAWARGDFTRAVAEWRAPATAGDAAAQFNLGQAYKLGRGVPTDQAMATEWFRKAAVQGHPQAIDNYGLALFQDGKKAEALPWLEKSVARDEKRTELVLGTMLFNGDSVQRDWTRAYALVTRSSQQGLPQASQTLAQMDSYIPEAQRQQGMVLARKIEADARSAALAAPAPGLATTTTPPPPRTVPLPSSTAPGAAYTRPSPSVTPAPTRPATSVATAPRPRPAAPRPVPATTGGAWRVQLGAFRDADNARSLWSRVGARVGGSPSYVQSGGITRLQATGFASKAAAEAACARAGGGCVVVSR